MNRAWRIRRRLRDAWPVESALPPAILEAHFEAVARDVERCLDMRARARRLGAPSAPAVIAPALVVVDRGPPEVPGQLPLDAMRILS